MDKFKYLINVSGDAAHQGKASALAAKEGELDHQRRQEQAPIFEDLQAAGVVTDVIFGTASNKSTVKAVVPVLARHLKGDYSLNTKSQLATALQVREASAVWGDLVDAYRVATRLGAEGKPVAGLNALQSNIAVALVAAVTASTFDDLLSLIRDAENGESRRFLLKGLKKFKSDVAMSALDEFSRDPVLMTSSVFKGKK